LANIEEILRMAEQGDTENEFQAGFGYIYGEEGFSADTNKGVEYLTKAADKGHMKAQFHLGNFYKNNRY